MDSEHFDEVVRALSSGASRRGVLAGLVSALLAAQPFTRAEDAAGKKRKGKRKKKHKKNKPAPCVPQCAGKLCGDDGCGGTCGTACEGANVCQDGTCVCPPGQGVCCDTAHGGGTCSAGEACCPINLINPDNAGCCPADRPCCNVGTPCPAPFNICPNGCCDVF